MTKEKKLEILKYIDRHYPITDCRKALGMLTVTSARIRSKYFKHLFTPEIRREIVKQARSRHVKGSPFYIDLTDAGKFVIVSRAEDKSIEPIEIPIVITPDMNGRIIETAYLILLSNEKAIEGMGAVAMFGSEIIPDKRENARVIKEYRKKLESEIPRDREKDFFVDDDDRSEI